MDNVVFPSSPRRVRLAVLTCLSVCLVGSGVAADTVRELAGAAAFTFCIVSDHNGDSPMTNLHFAKMDQWAKEHGDSFIIGLGDHVAHEPDPFIPFIHSDPFWHAQFYPCAGDHDNEYYGTGEDDWGAGGALFNEVELSSRPWVSIRENGCEYYAQIPVGDWTVHLIILHYPDQPPDPAVAFPESSRQYLIDTLNGITRGPKDIVIAGAHSYNGRWVDVLSPAQQQVVMEKCDLVLAGTSHRYERYIHPGYGETGGALCLNTGSVTMGTVDGYIECFVFDDPPRLVTIYHDCDSYASPQLRVGTVSHPVNWTTYWAYVKRLGQVAGSVSWMTTSDDWDAFPAHAASPEGAFGTGWNLMSVPIAPADGDPEVVLAGLAGGNILANNLFLYEPGVGYLMYPGQFAQMEQGRGYWLKLMQPGVTGYGGNSGPAEVPVPLSEGWTLIGTPRTWPVPLSSCRVKHGAGYPVSWATATGAGWVDPVLYYYDGGYKVLRASGGDDDRFRPWRGYWVRSYLAGLTLLVAEGVEPPPPVVIGDVAVTDITPTTALVTWTSLVHSSSQVEYGVTSAYGEVAEGAGGTRVHSVELSGLAPDTEFHYRVVSACDGYSPGVSPDATFTTAPSATLPANAGFESGTLQHWIPWPEGAPKLEIKTQSSLGPIYPRSGSYMAGSVWSNTDQGGGLYARVAAVPGHTYEASVWSNLYMAKYTEPFPPDEDCRSRVGIDPLGGRDPAAPSVVWSEWDQRPNRTPPEWRRLSVQAQAQAALVTIFLEFDQHYEAGYHVMVNCFDDASVMDVTP